MLIQWTPDSQCMRIWPAPPVWLKERVQSRQATIGLSLQYRYNNVTFFLSPLTSKDCSVLSMLLGVLAGLAFLAHAPAWGPSGGRFPPAVGDGGGSTSLVAAPRPEEKGGAQWEDYVIAIIMLWYCHQRFQRPTAVLALPVLVFLPSITISLL